MSQIKPNSISSQALRYLRAMDKWTSSAELCKHLSLDPKFITGNLSAALRRGEVQRRTDTHGKAFWFAPAMPIVPARIFSIPNWPPGFASRWDAIVRAEKEAARA